MRSIFIFIASIFYLNICFSQDIVGRRNRLTDSVIERFYVLKSNPDIRQGPYRAIFKHQSPVAVGNYNYGEKTGVWQFYNAHGRLIEKYNYNTKLFTFEAPLFHSDDLSFYVDAPMKETDTLTRPLKIGGSYFGFIPYVSFLKLPFDTFTTNTGYFDAYVELLISPLGRLADYKVYLISDYYQYYHVFTFDLSLFSNDDRVFIPAKLNGASILSRIIIKCFVTESGGLDFY